MDKVKLIEHRLFTCRSIIIEGPRIAVEAAARVLEYVEPKTQRQYAMHDLVTGAWRVNLEIPT